jgi:pilus assembly protein CpaB
LLAGAFTYFYKTMELNGSPSYDMATTTSAPAMMDVVVPITEIQPGTALEPRLFEVVQRPVDVVPTGAFTRISDIDRTYARSLLTARIPVVKDQVTVTKSSNLITQRIPEGYQAVTILVDARSSVEGWVLPGAKVDVVWTTIVGDQRTLKVIVQNAEVLSSERSTDPAPQKVTTSTQLGKAVAPAAPGTVTLLVSEEDAKKVHYASTTGILSLSLRGSEDASKGNGSANVTLNDMLGVKQPRSNVQAQVVFTGTDGKAKKLVMMDGRLQENPEMQLPPLALNEGVDRAEYGWVKSGKNASANGSGRTDAGSRRGQGYSILRGSK